jgi:hypothetical protein
MNLYFPSLIVTAFDLISITFFLWRLFDRKATLWGAARLIYSWITFTLIYHVAIYVASLFNLDPLSFINAWLHPYVLLFTINPVLVAIIHWRGGKL